jgi:hypothetical protein
MGNIIRPYSLKRVRRHNQPQRELKKRLKRLLIMKEMVGDDKIKKEIQEEIQKISVILI